MTQWAVLLPRGNCGFSPAPSRTAAAESSFPTCGGSPEPRWTRQALWRIGSAAWLLDESTIAVRLLQEAMARIQAPGRQGASGGGLTALAWLYLDTGRWDEALEAAAEAADLAEPNPDGHGGRGR